MEENPTLETFDQLRPELPRAGFDSPRSWDEDAGGASGEAAGRAAAAVLPSSSTLRTLLAATRMATVAKEELSVASATTASVCPRPAGPPTLRRMSLPSANCAVTESQSAC